MIKLNRKDILPCSVTLLIPVAIMAFTYYGNSRMVSVRYGGAEPRLQYSMYVTWANYFDLASQAHDVQEAEKAAEAAHYIVNGQDVGIGEAGFAEVIRRMKELPRGSSVKIFPYYDSLYRVHSEIEGPAVPYDFYDGHRAIRSVALRRTLKVVFSPTDENGKIVPQVQEMVDKWREERAADRAKMSVESDRLDVPRAGDTSR